MLEELRHFLDQFKFLSPKDVVAVAGLANVRRVKKGEHIFYSGDMHYTLYLVLTGFTRTYVVRDDGDERTVYLAGPGMGVGSSKTVYKDQPSNENVVALENCILISWDLTEFKRIAANRPAMYRWYAEMLERNFIEAVERVEFHTLMTPEQRYEYLLETRSDIFNRVPLKYIASYIGITPGSLSRLRARIVRAK